MLAVLRRRISDDEIDQVVALSGKHAHETPDATSTTPVFVS